MNLVFNLVKIVHNFIIICKVFVCLSVCLLPLVDLQMCMIPHWIAHVIQMGVASENFGSRPLPHPQNQKKLVFNSMSVLGP